MAYPTPGCDCETCARIRRPSVSEGLCACKEFCADCDPDGPGVCKGLPIKREPLVEIVMVPRDAR